MKLRRCIKIFRRTGLLRMLLIFVVFFNIASLIIRLVEPNINTVTDALWYTFVASTSIGFGDFVPVTHIGRVVTVLITIYEVVIAAMIPGVVVAFYMEYLKFKEQDTISTFLEKLENLPNLSQEELAELSDKVKRFNKK